MSSKFLESVINVFGSNANLMVFLEGESEVVVKGRSGIVNDRRISSDGFIVDEVWRELNELVREEFKGQYSPVERGWVIKKPKESKDQTRTVPYEVEVVGGEGEEEPMRGIDPYTGLPVSEPARTAEEPELEDVFPPEGFRVIPLENLVTSPVKLRQSIDDEYLEGLAESIRDKGILQPILVRRLPSGSFQIVAGEQRYRAAQKAGLTRIPCMVKQLSDFEASELSLIENVQRKDLTGYELARALDYRLKHFPEEYPTHEVLAFKFGKKRTWVTNHLRMLELEKDVSRETLEKMTEFQARTLLAAPKEKREEIIREFEESKEIPSAREIESKVKPKKTRKKKKAKYHCDWCGRDKEDYEVHTVPGRGWICNTCSRDVTIREEPPKKKLVFKDFQVPCDFCAKGETCDRSLFYAFEDGRTCDEYVEKPKPEEPKKAKVPPVHFRELMRMPVSKAEREVYHDLLRAYHDKRLLAQPFLNDDRELSYVVRATYPDIFFAGVEAPIYLDNEDVHAGREEWDEAVIKALERQGAHPERFPYTGTLGVGKRKDIVEKIIVKVNALKEGSE